MPIKTPDIWSQIWEWLQINFDWRILQSACSAIIISLLRMMFMRKKPAFRYMLFDAMICASIAGSIIPLLSHIFDNIDYSAFIGTMIGFIGTEKLREFLFKFLNNKISSESNVYPERKDENQ
ncbi:phage holin, lambda family [Lonepinella sp. BR2904]|uniref:phage holin, lambda family n=1 Tax=Lonepinella sp. BR2904 TaxID=3434551 RepID=UPI003F6DC251